MFSLILQRAKQWKQRDFSKSKSKSKSKSETAALFSMPHNSLKGEKESLSISLRNHEKKIKNNIEKKNPIYINLI